MPIGQQRESRAGRLRLVVVMLTTVATLVPSGWALADVAPQAIYEYLGPQGRRVYVNGIDRVPERYRQRSREVDLSHISLNEKLADDLKEAVDEQLGLLWRSNYCVTARGLAARPWWVVMWSRHSHLIVIGGVLLLFLLVSPFLVRTIGAPRWAKMLMVLLPLLVVLAVGSTVAVSTSHALGRVRQAADPCRPEQFAEVADTPAGQAQRVHLIQHLRQQIAGAGRLRSKRLERSLRAH